MKSSQNRFAFALLAVLASSCAHAGAPLAGSEWRPAEIAGLVVPSDPEMFVRFGAEGRLEGHGGCNGFFGSYKLDGRTIEIGPLGATRMACDEAVMDRELRFMELLGQAAAYAREGTKLSLTDAAGKLSMRLIQTDAD